MDTPLFVTDDAPILDELQRLAAAAGVTPALARDPEAALHAWNAAPLVFVGVDLAKALARLAPPRRAGVHLVGCGGVPDDVFRTALALGAENVAELPRSSGWVVELMADVGDSSPHGSMTIGVIAGSGGAGASTFACALGQMAARVGAGRRHRRRPARPGRRPGPRARRARRHPLGRAVPDHGPVQRALLARLAAAARPARRADLVSRTAGQPPGLRRAQRGRRRPAWPPDRRRGPAAQRRPLGRGAGRPLRPGVRAHRADRRRAGVGGAPVRAVPRPYGAAAGGARRTRPGRRRGPADVGPGRRADARPARPRGGDRPGAGAGAVAARSARPHRPEVLADLAPLRRAA